MNVSIKINIININQFNFYNQNDTIKNIITTLISELNIHYGMINNYIDLEGTENLINIEICKTLVKLTEISSLALPNTNDQHDEIYKLNIKLIDSVIVILNMNVGQKELRRKLLNLGDELLSKLYNFNYDDLISESLRYLWLNQNKLIPTPYKVGYETNLFYTSCKNNNTLDSDEKIKFTPSDEEISAYHIENMQTIYQFMVFEMHNEFEINDPFDNEQACLFYHYHETLNQLYK